MRPFENFRQVHFQEYGFFVLLQATGLTGSLTPLEFCIQRDVDVTYIEVRLYGPALFGSFVLFSFILF